MTLRNWHGGTLAVLWTADFLLLLTIWPVEGDTQTLGAVVLMWLVPTIPLALLTWRWWGARSAP